MAIHFGVVRHVREPVVAVWAAATSESVRTIVVEAAPRAAGGPRRVQLAGSARGAGGIVSARCRRDVSYMSDCFQAQCE